MSLRFDKRFIDSVDGDGRDSRLAAAIIGLARELDLRCIAEGVERATQHTRLEELGCDHAQGFLLGRPMSADALRELLRANVPTRPRGRLNEHTPSLRSGPPRHPNFLRRSERHGPRSTTRPSRTTAEH
jgi:predicted signal transduction protein with EAL and GGDEF domain